MQKIFLSALLAAFVMPAAARGIDFATTRMAYTLPAETKRLCRRQNAETPCTDINIALLRSRLPWLNTAVNRDAALMRQEIGETVPWLNETLRDGRPAILTYTRRLGLISASPQIIQIAADDYRFSGGAHGIPTRTFYVFDRKRQKRLTLADILLPNRETALKKRLTARLKSVMQEQAKESGGLLGERAFTEHLNAWPMAVTDNFYFTPQGITFSYNPYELGPYAMGFVVLGIQNSDLAGLIRPSFQKPAIGRFTDPETFYRSE
ncbi:RsiV family protein [Neisseria leonii]|uniref:RsiV family protein n=1 Tax=Neisseria leonii TaxID=2995413 RepID=UPI00237B68C5|nr:RsiV family protein [Neisseria sp. 3986]MDD9325427.1 RsiV family protein [Neisseria sp. 3986]